MPEHHSRADKRVEQILVNDSPHELYKGRDPFTGETLDNGIPVLKSSRRGAIIKKEVIYNNIHCPECEIPAKYTHDSEPVCPKCGIICSGTQGVPERVIIRDAKASGRLDGSSEENSA